MKASFELKICNNVDLKDATCLLSGHIGANIVGLQVFGPKKESLFYIELPANELIIAASRLSAGPDGLCPFPEGTTKV